MPTPVPSRTPPLGAHLPGSSEARWVEGVCVCVGGGCPDSGGSLVMQSRGEGMGE